MTTIRVEEYAAVAVTTYLYNVEVDDSVAEDEALAQAIEAVKRGDVSPWDSETWDTLDSGRTTYDAQVVRARCQHSDLDSIEGPEDVIGWTCVHCGAVLPA